MFFFGGGFRLECDVDVVGVKEKETCGLLTLQRTNAAAKTALCRKKQT